MVCRKKSLVVSAFYKGQVFARKKSGGKSREPERASQNSQQKSVPDLNVLTVAFLALKKMVFLKKKIFF